MNHQPKSSTDVAASLLLRGGLALLVLVAWFVTTTKGQEQNQPGTSVASSSIHVKHVLGFEDVSRNADGELSIHEGDLRFERHGSPAVQVTITSIQNIFLGGEDKQVGGVPMMLGKTAVPFGGGRIVSLFSHKKYDSLTIESLDSSGGFHGAIFQLDKGQAQSFKNDLIAHGAHIIPSEDSGPVQATSEEFLTAVQQWNVQVERIDP